MANCIIPRNWQVGSRPIATRLTQSALNRVVLAKTHNRHQDLLTTEQLRTHARMIGAFGNYGDYVVIVNNKRVLADVLLMDPDTYVIFPEAVVLDPNGEERIPFLKAKSGRLMPRFMGTDRLWRPGGLLVCVDQNR